MGEVSVVIPANNNDGVTGLCLQSIAGLNCHAGVAEIAGRHSIERAVGIAERCGLRHGLRRQDQVMRFVSARVSLERGVMMVMLFAGFVFMLCLLVAGGGCAGLLNVGLDAGWRAAMVVGGVG